MRLFTVKTLGEEWLTINLDAIALIQEHEITISIFLTTSKELVLSKNDYSLSTLLQDIRMSTNFYQYPDDVRVVTNRKGRISLKRKDTLTIL